MAYLLDSKLGFGAACVLGAAAAIMGVVYLRDGGAPPAAPAPQATASASWDGPLGPGLVAPAAGITAAPMGEQPLAAADGRLVVDQALHRLFDSFLDEGHLREQALRGYLKSRLKPPALAQAEALAGDYARYLQAEAALRARARPAPVDSAGLGAVQVEQMQAWLLQRGQLRERMLGLAVAQAWFGLEDEDCRAAFADWRKMRAPPGSEDVDSNELRARRLHGAVLEQTRNERALSCAGQLMAGLAAGRPAS
jgi:lipase chaperone LimK